MSLYSCINLWHLPAAATETGMFISRQKDKNMIENEQAETSKKYWKKKKAQSRSAVYFKRNPSPVVAER